MMREREYRSRMSLPLNENLIQNRDPLPEIFVKEFLTKVVYPLRDLMKILIQNRDPLPEILCPA